MCRVWSAGGIVRIVRDRRRALKPLAPSEALAANSEFQIRIDHDLDEASRPWAELEKHATAFQTRSWLSPWYRIVAPSIRAAPLFVTVLDQRSRPLAFFPLCIRLRWGVSVLEFPDHGVSDYNTPIVAPGGLTDEQADRVWIAIRAALPRIDLVHIDKMPGSYFERPNPFASFDWLRPMEMRCWNFQLPATRADFDARLKKKDRKEQRRKRRNLVDALGDARLVHAMSEIERRRFFETLRLQRAMRFKDQRRRDILQDPLLLRFYETVISGAADGFVALSALDAGSCSPATLLALRNGDTYYLIMHSFDISHEHLSPGIVALDEMMSHLIATGTAICDFTIGNEPYKRQFGVEERLLYRGFDPITPRGRLVARTLTLMQQIETNLVRARRDYLARRDGDAAAAPTAGSGATGD